MLLRLKFFHWHDTADRARVQSGLCYLRQACLLSSLQSSQSSQTSQTQLHIFPLLLLFLSCRFFPPESFPLVILLPPPPPPRIHYFQSSPGSSVQTKCRFSPWVWLVSGERSAGSTVVQVYFSDLRVSVLSLFWSHHPTVSWSNPAVDTTSSLEGDSPFWFFNMELDGLFPRRIKDLLEKFKLKPE